MDRAQEDKISISFTTQACEVLTVTHQSEAAQSLQDRVARLHTPASERELLVSKLRVAEVRECDRCLVDAIRATITPVVEGRARENTDRLCGESRVFDKREYPRLVLCGINDGKE